MARSIGPSTVHRVVCHCRYCVAYPALLGKAAQVLDAHGGSDVFQMAPGDLEISEGLEHLRCLRLTDHGALRWYADCCDTPIASTLPKPGVPFVAVMPMALQLDGDSRQARLGPVRARVNGDFSSVQARRLAATRWALLRLLLRYLWMMAKWRVRGQHRPQAFFDAQTGQPIRPPIRRALPGPDADADVG